MKKTVSLAGALFVFNLTIFCQEKESHNKIKTPEPVTAALYKKYADAKNVTWEKEKGNYEANWGGKSGEDNSVQFTPGGKFIEIVNAIPVHDLPKSVVMYINEHYKGARITEAGKVTDAVGKISYEAEIKGKDVIFDVNGNFVKSGK